MTYVPDLHWSGVDAISMYVDDESGLRSEQKVVNVVVNDVNDAAIVELPMTDGIPLVDAIEDETINVEGVRIIDVDLGPYSILELSIRPGNGTISFSQTKGIKYSKEKNVFIGQLDALNRALRGMSYKGSIDFFGFDKIEFAVREPGTQSKTTTATLWINIKATNGKPKVITNPVNFTIGCPTLQGFWYIFSQ